jgi:hypothetical protein
VKLPCHLSGIRLIIFVGFVFAVCLMTTLCNSEDISVQCLDRSEWWTAELGWKQYGAYLKVLSGYLLGRAGQMHQSPLDSVSAEHRSLHLFFPKYYYFLHRTGGYAVAQLVEALRYKPEGRGFDFRWSHWNFSVT